MATLMGSSGAGKITLMDVIAGRKTGGVIKGKILVNGMPKTTVFSKLMGYVEQIAIHSPHQSLEELVHFCAYLRQKASVPKDVKDDFIETDRPLSLHTWRAFLARILSKSAIQPCKLHA